MDAEWVVVALLGLRLGRAGSQPRDGGPRPPPRARSSPRPPPRRPPRPRPPRRPRGARPGAAAAAGRAAPPAAPAATDSAEPTARVVLAQAGLSLGDAPVFASAAGSFSFNEKYSSSHASSVEIGVRDVGG